MHNDTDLGGPSAEFPPTKCTILAASSSPDPEVRRQAFDSIIAAYWKPIYRYIRIRWKASNDDAKDLTQAFLAQTLEKPFFDRYDPAVTKFRTYLRSCIDKFVANEQKSAGRIKRGGHLQHFSLDFDGAESDLPASSAATDFDDFFYREWVRQLFELAVEGLRCQCEENSHRVHFELFESYDLKDNQQTEPVSYAELGERYGITVTQVTNYLAWVRRQFRGRVLDALRASTGSEEEFRLEAARLFGVFST